MFFFDKVNQIGLSELKTRLVVNRDKPMNLVIVWGMTEGYQLDQ